MTQVPSSQTLFLLESFTQLYCERELSYSFIIFFLFEGLCGREKSIHLV